MTSNKLFLSSYFLLSVIVIVNCGKSEEKCKEYRELFKDYTDPTFLSDVESNITLTSLGKEPAEYGEFPHMVALLYNVKGTLKMQAGGVLISERFVLSTAANRAYNRSPLSHVRLGAHNISNSDDENVQEIKVKNTIVHPDWRRSTVYNDIMLIELSEPVKFNEYVIPACLYTKAGLPSDVEISAAGWGRIDPGPSDILHKVYLDIFSYEECITTYKPDKVRMQNGVDNKTMICAGGKTIPKDTCYNDAGGPLQFYDEDMNNYEIVGLTSFGKKCGFPLVPGIYTRISAYVPWIESIVWKD